MRKHDLALLVVFSLVAVWKWSPVIGTPTVLPDEEVYLRAARHLAAGGSPYAEPGYLYPPPTAVLIQAIAPRLGEVGALKVLRVLALAGVVLTVWLALREVHQRLWLALPFGVLFITVAPAVDIATSLGNTAGLAAGLVVFGLLGWRRRPILAGLLLGVGLAIKPIAPLAPLLLAVHRPAHPTHNHLIAAALSVLAAAITCLGNLSFLPRLMKNASGYSNEYNFSLRQLLSDFGLELPALLIVAVIAVISIIPLRRADLDPPALMAIIVTANLIALPILWAHSLLLLLPVQVLALDACSAAPSSPLRRSSLRFPLLVALAFATVAATLLAQAVGTTDGLPECAGTMARAAPLVSIPFLGWFVYRSRPPRTSGTASAW